ncbi:MAG: holo-ACP synthase [Hungatella sp.]|nr:holo-ACP synthase [Hungatella sp.]
MIIGIGTDMIEMERMRKACEKQAFLARIYTAEECRQARGSISRLAGNFAVKEAVAKALGTGFQGFGPKEIEVLRDEKGKPYVRVFGGAGKRARELGIHTVHVSITNLREYASAFAVAEGEGPGRGCGDRQDPAAHEREGGTLYEISGDRAADEGD